MSSGPQRFRLPEVMRAIEAYSRAMKTDAKDVRVDFRKDGSYSIYAAINPQAHSPMLEAGKEIIL